MLLNLDPSDTPLTQAFQKFVRGAEFPCVGAKSACANHRLFFYNAQDIRSAWDDLSIHDALARFVRLFRQNVDDLWSFAILFHHPDAMSEAGFEDSLWARLQSLTDKDEWLGYASDPQISTEPNDPNFGLSFAGEGFFAVGLHPGASRPARRFEAPAIILNPHAQFRALRDTGKYERLRETILARDEAVACTPNPMIARHGTISEARQYSGREVGADWSCPFHKREVDRADAA
jgi:uncharacterized protein